MLLALTPSRHRLLSERSLALLSYLKRRLPSRVAKALGAYYHMWTQKLVFFLWIDRRKRLVSEGISLNDPAEFNAEHLELLRSQFTPQAFGYARIQKAKLLAEAVAERTEFAQEVHHEDQVRQWYIDNCMGPMHRGSPTADLDLCGTEGFLESLGKAKYKHRVSLPATLKEPE